MSENGGMIKVTALGQTKEFPYGTTYGEISRGYADLVPHQILLVKEGVNKLHELNHRAEKDCSIEFLTIVDKEGRDTYKRSLCLMMLKAFDNVLAGEEIHVWMRFTVSGGLFCTLQCEHTRLDQNLLDRVRAEMERLRDQAIPIRKKSLKTEEVIRLFRNELAASAGPGEILDAARGEEVFVFADKITDGADEIIRVNGNSMEPTYSDGDQVLIRHTAGVRPGEIGVFICGDTGYIKEYRKDGLHSHNPAYATISFTEGESVKCIGKVLGKVKREDWADSESFAAWLEYEQKGR